MPRNGGLTNRVKIVTVDSGNVAEYGFFCVSDPKHPGFQRKLEWLRKRFREGLRMKLIFPPGAPKAAGFIEYIPGQHAWRPVEADGYMMIHCIFIDKRKYKAKGYGTLMIQECIDDARSQGMKGVTAVASEGTWMTGPDLFIKNGFEIVDEAPPYFKLMAIKFRKKSPPKFKGDWQRRLGKYGGLHVIYTDQCPFSARFLYDIEEFANEEGIGLKSRNLRTCKEAQKAPCAYGTFTLVYNGKAVADHPVSRTRFRNIVSKELKLL